MDPVSQKLTSILSASYSDADIRDALSVLDSRLSQNTPDSRRQLRIDVQADVIQTNASIIHEFTKIAEQLKQIGSALNVMNKACQDMRQHISAASSETAPILEEANTLMTQKQQVETKEQLLSAFTEHFVVSDEDIYILTSSAELVDDRFFQILGRVKAIHEDCQVLLANENQRAGLEIMEQMTKHLHAAFQKLYRWIQREFKHLSLENHQVNAGIRRALRVLAERPTLFQSCLDFFSEARRKILLQSFFDALTGSEQEIASGVAKPIELYAHDPLRYIGDMLAWLHSATVSEQEALEVLFISGEESSIAKSIETGLASEPWEEGFNAKESLMMLVDKNLESVCKPLKSRVEQVIASHDDSTLAFRISNLINFYRLTFEKILGKESNLLEMMRNMEQFALRQFQNNLQDHVRQVQADLPQVPQDLSPPEFLQDALKELRLLMLSYDSSLTPPAEKEAEFMAILVEALDPYLKGCESLSNDLRPPLSHIFMTNCLLASKATLEQFSFTKARIASLDNSLEKHITALVAHIHIYTLESSGLQPLLQALAEWDRKSAPLSQIPEFSPHSLSQISQKLDHFLPSALMDAQNQLQKLLSPKTVSTIIQQASDAFINEFATVEQVLVGDDGIEFARAIWPRTTEEVKVLLS
ncbi:oligomeric Golgi complex subunit 6 [Kalaharituber pfeilii]|nr:oligomeric Golgi complex subunit 6 [Kalaharituber pfeilii]